MSGNNKSKVIQRLKELDNIFTEYHRKVGLGHPSVQNEVERFINMTPTDMRQLNQEECGEASAILNQSALHLQLEIGKLTARANWCSESIDFCISNTIQQYSKFMSKEYKRAAAIKGDDVAMKFQQALMDTQLRLDLLSFVPQQLRALSESFISLQRAKGARI